MSVYDMPIKFSIVIFKIVPIKYFKYHISKTNVFIIIYFGIICHIWIDIENLKVQLIV